VEDPLPSDFLLIPHFVTYYEYEVGSAKDGREAEGGVGFCQDENRERAAALSFALRVN